MEESDEALAGKLKTTGDIDAFRMLYQRHREKLHAFCSRLLGRDGRAEEITHEAFLAVYEKARLFSPERGSFRAWLYAIAYHECCHLLRERPTVVSLDQEAGAGDPLDDRTESHLAGALTLAAALQSLPESHRSAIVLTKLHGLTVRECAAALGISEDSVKQRVCRGIRTLHARLTSAPGLGR